MAREVLPDPIFERLMSTGSEAFSLLVFLDGTKIVQESVFSLIRNPLPFILIPENLAYPLPKNEKLHYFWLTCVTEK